MTAMQKSPFAQAGTAARFIGAAFGLIFAGIGVVVIGSLWFADDGFGSPPLIVKMIGSFIALGFVVMGGTMAVSSFVAGSVLEKVQHTMREANQHIGTRPASDGSAAPPRGYTCPHCGGGIGEKADVSPMGDTKCGFCGRWFNVHGRQT